MTPDQWNTGRHQAGLTQIDAARSLKISQPYLSQLETGLRLASAQLARKAAKLYKLPPTALPISKLISPQQVLPDDLQRKLASLGYPGFEHARVKAMNNPAEVVLSAILNRDLDTRLVEALPWVLGTYTDLNWDWLRDRAKLHNAQNRLGYLVHLATEILPALTDNPTAVQVLSKRQEELEEARLAHEGTLCRDSMREPERVWHRKNRPPAASHWNLLSSLAADQLPYASR